MHVVSNLRIWSCRGTENRNLTDPEEIEKAIKMGEYIRNGACLNIHHKPRDPYTLVYRNTRPIFPPQISTFEAHVSQHIAYGPNTIARCGMEDALPLACEQKYLRVRIE